MRLIECRFKRYFEYSLIALAYIAPVTVFVAITTLIGFIIWQGFGAINLSLFFDDVAPLSAITGKEVVWDGIWSACVGTFCLMALTLLFALPVGIGSGVYLALYANKVMQKCLGFAVDTLAGIPSIIMGLFGFTLILFLRKTFWSDATTGLLLAAFCLALLVLPVIIVGTRSAIDSLPASLAINSLALGYNSAQTTWHVLLPSASKGILSAALLSIGRSAEDTAVIMLTGVVANAGLPNGFMAKFEALPFAIYYASAQYQNLDELARAYATSLVLLVLSVFLLIFATWLQAKLQRRWCGLTFSNT